MSSDRTPKPDMDLIARSRQLVAESKAVRRQLRAEQDAANRAVETRQAALSAGERQVRPPGPFS